MGERRLCTAEVRGSNPLGSTAARRLAIRRGCKCAAGFDIVIFRGVRILVCARRKRRGVRIIRKLEPPIA